MILDSRGSPIQHDTPQQLRLKYDAARPDRMLDDHWSAGVDSLSAAAGLSPDVRRKVRERARYEVANNAHAQASVATLVHDVCGLGPKLNVESDDVSLASQVETAWRRWFAASGIAQTLQTARRSQAIDGEVFAVLSSNPAVTGPVKLALRLIETEQVALPWSGHMADREMSDGIRFDEFGNPTAYHVLRHHPGDTGYWGAQDGTWIDARHVLHVFHAERPGQVRGVSELVSSLSLWAKLRRYTDAVVASAEIAASVSLWLQTQQIPSSGMTFIDPADAMPFSRGTMAALPAGYSVEQLKAEQPTQTYEGFKGSLIAESGRSLNQGRGKASGDYSGFNYSSARMEGIEYERSVECDRHRLECQFLNRVYDAWLYEAVMVGVVPVEALELMPQWRWPGLNGHQDPAKESNAQAVRLASNTTTLAREYARQGLDWEAELRQRAKEKALMRELGLTEGEVMPQDTEDNDDE